MTMEHTHLQTTTTYRDGIYAAVAAVLCFPFVLLSIGTATAQVMESTNYQLQSDSINIGGGLSTSSSYSLESTGGEIASGESSSETYALKAGYQQMQEVFISLAGTTNVTLSPTIGAGGGTANGSTTATVITDGVTGYELTIKSSNSPAMQSGANTIDDYTPAGASPDYTFTTGASDAHFGYSPYGDDTVARFLDDGAANCNTGSSNGVATCWDGLSTSTEAIASATNANHPNGATTTIYFRLAVGASASPVAGTYVATTTITALPQ